MKAKTADDLPNPASVGDVYYMQDYLRRDGETRFIDWRIFVSNGTVLAAMARVGKTWITNIHQGAEPLGHEPDSEMERLALEAAKAVGADYAGVDLICDQEGNLLVLEINSNPAWKGLQSVTDINIAWTLAEHFLASLKPVSS
jgi:glutathione synthase/RimK-type ligase-like ATP-grasp enzyme